MNTKGFGKQKDSKQKLLGYVLLQPKHDDYLSLLNAGEDMSQTLWCSHPSDAKVFDESTAKQVAIELVFGKPDYEVVLCRLFETTKQYKVEQVTTFFGK